MTHSWSFTNHYFLHCVHCPIFTHNVKDSSIAVNMERKGEKAFCSPVKFKLRWGLVAQCQSRNQKLLSIPCKWDLRVPPLGESQADLSPPLHLFKRNVFTSLFLFSDLFLPWSQTTSGPELDTDCQVSSSLLLPSAWRLFPVPHQVGHFGTVTLAW
jgi:hypothetical protein